MITLDQLTVRYRQHTALQAVSGTFAAGSLTAVIGPNGAGKSTLLKSLVGALPGTTGACRVQASAQRIAYLPQLNAIDRSFPMAVRDCVSLGFWSACGPWAAWGGARSARVDAALHAVDMAAFAARPIGTLSSGQLQRVMFARLLVQDAQLILLDEPFSAIDQRTTQALLQIVCQWHQEKRTVVAVLHDDAQVRALFPQTLLLARQVVAWGPTEEVLTEPNLQHARTLAQAWDDEALHATAA